jgi:hypothetical protein
VRGLQTEQSEGVVRVARLAEDLSANRSNARTVNEGSCRRVAEDILQNSNTVQEEVLKNNLSGLSGNETVTKLSEEPLARFGQRVKQRNRELSRIIQLEARIDSEAHSPQGRRTVAQAKARQKEHTACVGRQPRKATSRPQHS